MKSRFLFAAKFVFSTMIIGLAAFSFELKAAPALQIYSKPVPSVYAGAAFNIDADEKRVFDLVNREREKHGLSLMEWNPALSQLARNYSIQMAEENFFGHFDRNGAGVADRAGFMKIKGWRKIGENLFSCSGTNNYTSFAVQKWMKSPTHRENILNPEWTMSGIGVAESENGEIFVTQVFIRN
jgi:uncharacterized protein YkwD